MNGEMCQHVATKKKGYFLFLFFFYVTSFGASDQLYDLI